MKSSYKGQSTSVTEKNLFQPKLSEESVSYFEEEDVKQPFQQCRRAYLDFITPQQIHR